MTAELVQQSLKLLSHGRASEAVQQLQAALPSDNPAIHTVLGHALYQDDRLAEARRTLDAALKRFPFDPQLNDAAARTRWVDGAGDSFADDFLAAVAAQPENLPLRYKCIDLLRLAGKQETAERLIREILVRLPNDISAKAFLGVLLDETDRLEEALPLLQDTVRAVPNEAMLRLNLSHVLMRMGRAAEAMEHIGWIRRGHPSMQIGISYESLALKQLGDSRYDWLCNYDRHLKIYDIDPPNGFATIADFNAALAARLRSLHDASAHPLEQSLRGGSQTSHNLIFADDPLLKSYFQALDAPIRAYIGELGNDSTHPMEQYKSSGYYLSGCWSVLLRANGFHVNHTHPNGWISSSYYVSLPSQMGEQNHEGWIKFGEPRWPIPGCGIERTIQPKEGRLVLFPSYYWHGTIPFSSGTRLTAPIDIIPR